MTPRQWRNRIANLLDLLPVKGLAVHTQPVVAPEAGKGRVRIAWPTPAAGMQDQPFLADFHSVETYLGWLRTEQFSAVLFDGSLLQLTFDIEDSDLVGHRLGYIPCPFILDEEGKALLRSEPIIDVIELFRWPGEEYLRLRTPIRFDFDPDAASEQHPASHLTLNDQDCRIPVRGPMSLGHFIEFVFRHFYPAIWAEHDFLVDIHRETMSHILTLEQEAGIHIDWWTDAGAASNDFREFGPKVGALIQEFGA